MAQELAKRSLCSRDQVGCVITDSNNKIIGEGYNGPPSGFWHAQQPCTQWCQRAKNAGAFAAVAVAALNAQGEVIKHLSLHPAYEDCPALHAEANALMMSDRTLRAGGTLYVTSHICIGCAKLIANSGVAFVYVATDQAVRDYRNADKSYEFMSCCGLTINVNGQVTSRKASQE